MQLSEEDMQQLVRVHDYFKEVDTDGTGLIDENEFQQCYVALISQVGLNLPPYDECIVNIDLDHNKHISYNEFVLWMKQLGVLSLKAS